MKNFLKIIFVAVLITPLLLLFLNLGVEASRENRKLELFPSITENNPKQFLDKLGKYFVDHFPFKTSLIDSKLDFDSILFNRLFNTDRVGVGTNDFLFYTNENAINSIQNRNLLSSDRLDDFVSIERVKKRFLDSLNILFVRSIYPNKHTIYREFLPKYITSGIIDTCSFYDQVIKVMAKNELPFLDLRDSLLLYKKDQIIYRYDDTHHNALGAFYSYRAMMYSVFNLTADSSYLPLQINPNALQLGFTQNKGGDLLKMLGSDHVLAKDCKVPFLKVMNSKIVKDTYEGFYHSINKNANNNKKIMLISDSYGLAQRLFFSNHFSEFLHIYKVKFDEEMILQFNPDIIIESFVERNAR